MSERTRGDRDEPLGAALRKLEAPPLPPGFHARLKERLLQEQGRNRRRRRRARLAGWGAAAAAVIAAALLVLASLPERSPLAPEVALAGQVKAKVARAFASIETLRGTLVMVRMLSDERVEQRVAFVRTAEGDMRATMLLGGVVREVAYDPRRGVRRELERYPDGRVEAREIRGLATGPPDDGGDELLSQRPLRAFVQALLAADDVRVRRTTSAGRPAWLVDTPLEPLVCRRPSESCQSDDADSPDHLSITVDQASGVPLGVLATRAGTLVEEIRLEDLAVDKPVSQAELGLAFPPEVDVIRQDGAFARSPLEKVAGLVGHRPLVPTRLPDGYQLAEVAATRPGHAPALANRTNPESRNVVSLAFRRGLDVVVVTTRARGGTDATWTDPFLPKASPHEDFQWATEDVTLRSGALAEARAEVVVDPKTVPHLWALGARVVVTVAGDLGHDDLVGIAESLASHGGGRP